MNRCSLFQHFSSSLLVSGSDVVMKRAVVGGRLVAESKEVTSKLIWVTMKLHSGKYVHSLRGKYRNTRGRDLGNPAEEWSLPEMQC